MSEEKILSDEELQQQARAGSREAEEALVVRYGRLVRICARPCFLAGGDSEDLIQEGMMGLLSAIREYDPHMSASFKTFAELCIKRRIYSAVKGASRKKHQPLNDGLSLEQVLSEESQSHLAFNESFRRIPEEQVLARESESEILAFHGSMFSKLEKEVLGLYLQGLSCQEIAAVTSRPTKSVDNAIQRIRRKLIRAHQSGEISID